MDNKQLLNFARIAFVIQPLTQAQCSDDYIKMYNSMADYVYDEYLYDDYVYDEYKKIALTVLNESLTSHINEIKTRAHNDLMLGWINSRAKNIPKIPKVLWSCVISKSFDYPLIGDLSIIYTMTELVKRYSQLIYRHRMIYGSQNRLIGYVFLYKSVRKIFKLYPNLDNSGDKQVQSLWEQYCQNKKT